MKRNNYFSIIAVIAFIGFAVYFGFGKFELSKQDFNLNKKALAEKFDYLSKNGNSSCSAAFRESISSMPDTFRLQGSCCSPMS
jgi:hypothetical protein